MDYSDLIGCKFTVHGRTKESGFDCYGLAIEVLRRNGIKLYDVFYEDLLNEKSIHEKGFVKNCVTKLDKEVPLCIIEINVNGNPTHIGVYIGNGMMIHTSGKLGVIIEPIQRYRKRIVGYYKVTNS